MTNSNGNPPASRTPSLARFARRSSGMLQGVTSFHDDATPTCELPQSASVMPTARNMARAGARPRPSVTSWLRGFGVSAMRRSVRARRTRPTGRDAGWVASVPVDDLRFDKLYRYDELMAALDCPCGRARPDLVTLESHRTLVRGARHPARDRHQHRHRAAPREARGVGRREHPLDRGHRVDRRAAPAAPARHRPRQPTSA